MKKIIAIGLAISMFAAFATGCGKSDTEKTTTSTTMDASQSGEPAKLKIVNFGDTTPRRTEFFTKTLHDKVLNELNIDLTVDFYPWGDQKPNLMFASGEDFSTFSDLANNVPKGFYAEIPKESFEKYAPDLLKIINEKALDSCKVNGKIYAVPLGNKPYAGEKQCIMFRQDLLDEVGVKDISTIADVENAMKLVKEKHPDNSLIEEACQIGGVLRQELEPNQLVTYLDNIGNGFPVAYVDSLTDDDKVYSYIESNAFKNLCAVTKRWKEEGYITQTHIANPSQTIADWAAGKSLWHFGNAARPMEQLPVVQKAVPTATLEVYKIGSMPYMYDMTCNVSYAISAASNNVNKYLELFNWMNASQENYDLLAYGELGKDYTLENNKVKKLVPDMFWDEWQLFNLTYGRYLTTVSDEFIEKYMKWDEGAIKAKKLGFTFDGTNVKTELAKLTALYKEKVQMLEFGFLDYDKDFPGILKELKAAGLDKYLAEMQKQFSEWYAKQPR